MNDEETQIEDLLNYTNRIKRTNNTFIYDTSNYSSNQKNTRSASQYLPQTRPSVTYFPTVTEESLAPSYRGTPEPMKHISAASHKGTSHAIPRQTVKFSSARAPTSSLNDDIVRDLRAEIERLTLRNQKLSESANLSSSTVESLKQLNAKYSSEIAHLQTQLSQKSNEDLNFKRRLSERDLTIETLKAENISLENRVILLESEAQKDAAALKTKNEQIEYLETSLKDNSVTKHTIDKLQRELIESNELNTKLTRKLEKYKLELSRSEHEFSSITEMNATLKLQIDSLEKTIQQQRQLLTDQAGKISALSDRTDYRDMEMKLEEALNDCLAAMNELEKKDEENSKLVKNNSQLKKELKKLSSQADNFVSDKMNYELIISELKTENNSLKLERKRLKSKKSSSKVRTEDLTEITNKYIELDRENQALKTAIETIKSTNSSLMKDVELMSQEVNRLKKLEKEQLERYSKIKTLLDASNVKLQNREQNLLKQSFEAELLKQKLQTATTDLEKARSEITATRIALRKKEEEKCRIMENVLQLDRSQSSIKQNKIK